MGLLNQIVSIRLLALVLVWFGMAVVKEECKGSVSLRLLSSVKTSACPSQVTSLVATTLGICFEIIIWDSISFFKNIFLGVFYWLLSLHVTENEGLIRTD